MQKANDTLDKSKLVGNLGGSGGIGGIANAAASAIGGAINPNGNSTGVGNAMQAIGSAASNIPGIGGLIGAGVNMLGGVVNAGFGSNIDSAKVNQIENSAKNQAAFMSSANDNDSLLSDWGSHTDLASVSKSDIGSEGWFSNKATNKARELNEEIAKANMRAWQSLGNTAANVDANNDRLMMANFAADGGSINIKPENRGKFTELKERTGKSSTWYKEHGTPEQRKMAVFALNARKWKHADGGPLTHGGVFDNGVTFIGTGGTHEENPFEGVQMGVDNEGVPNLVEEGEVIFNDYVFSKRMKVPKKLKKALKLRGDTFADAAKNISRESEERPNDPISKRGLESMLGILASGQEEERIRKENMRNNSYACGGRLFDVGGPIGYDRSLTSDQASEFENRDFYQAFLNRLRRLIQGRDTYNDGMYDLEKGKIDKLMRSINSDSRMNGYKLKDYNDFLRLASDGKIGPVHQAVADFINSERNESRSRYKRDAEGNWVPDSPESIFSTDEDYLNNLKEVVAKRPDDITNVYVKTGKTNTRNTFRGPRTTFELAGGSDLVEGNPLIPWKRSGLAPRPVYSEGTSNVSGDTVSTEDKTGTDTSDPMEVERMRNHPLRYAPIVGAGIAVANDLFGGNEPDYSNADLFAEAIRDSGSPIGTRPIGNYLPYEPLDRMFYINQLNRNAASGRRDVMNVSGGNRAAALSGILASDMNYGDNLGDIARKSEEYNRDLRSKVADFNRQTDMFNSQQGTQVDMFNSNLGNSRAQLYGNLATMRQGILNANREEKSANLTNFIQGLGDLGREMTDRDMLRWMADNVTIVYNPKGEYTGYRYSVAPKAATKTTTPKATVSKYGGRINRKKGITL